MSQSVFLRRCRHFLIAVSLGFLLTASLCFADNPLGANYSGSFAGSSLSIELSESGGAYTGTITKGQNKFPAKATVTAQGLNGSFTAGGSEFPFTATLAGDQMTLVTGQATYTLTRAAANPLGGNTAPATPVNPLEQPTTPAPPAPTPSAGESVSAPGVFTVLGLTGKGQTLFLKLPQANTFEAAVTQTADALGSTLDAKPNLTNAFADSKNKNKGGATFTGKLKGRDVKGVILSDTDAQGSTADVVIDSADATNADTAALMDFIPKSLKMTIHTFPDNSGSIDLPEGWTTPTVSASDAVVAIGPAGQAVIFGSITEIYDPNCRTVRLSNQTYQTALATYNRQMQNYKAHQKNPLSPGPAKPPQAPTPPEDPNIVAVKQGSPLRYCKYCDGPEEVLKVWYPLLAKLSEKANKPYTTVDKIITVEPASVDLSPPNTKAGTVFIAVTDHRGKKLTHLHAVNYMSTTNTVAGEVWQLDICSMRAPDESFYKDLPVMIAIQNSIKLNMQVVAKEINDIGQATRAAGQAAFDQMEKNHAAFEDQQAQEFADFQQRMAAQQKASHDSSSDMIEFAGGLRNVYDSETGQWGQVDLLNSDAIVGALNAASDDPHRFIQIPLRYLR